MHTGKLLKLLLVCKLKVGFDFCLCHLESLVGFILHKLAFSFFFLKFVF